MLHARYGCNMLPVRASLLSALAEDLKNSEWDAFRLYMSRELPGEMQRLQVGRGPGDAAAAAM